MLCKVFLWVVVSLAALPSFSQSFSVVSSTTTASNFKTQLFETYSLSTASKYFQLEEDEDKDICSTEIFLADDGTVKLFDTDGPLPIQASGTWSQNGDEFEMTIKRIFNGGLDHTDIGEFQYEVTRRMKGDISLVGGLVSVQGGIHILVRHSER